VKVSIVPRGVSALGYAQYLPKEQSIYQVEQMIDDICMSLGGRVAESIIFGKISTGALSDLERVTQIAYSMISIYGMSEKIGNISFYNLNNSESSFSKPYSEDTSKTIDSEVRDLISLCYNRTEKLLFSRIKELRIIAKELLKKEVIFKSDLERLIGERPIIKKL
jgi:cell division protease FtsH|tara:strand:+ start:242 stop:736 length:495 start_codon:yes stop_codon:yes gene_type:complete